jgi:beta-lactamase superfamily II metal-dependent hydrolase
MADAGVSIQKKLVRSSQNTLHASVLMAPKQGRDQIPNPDFLKAVAPSYVVLSSTRTSNDIEAAYQALGGQLINTRTTGGVRFLITPDNTKRTSLD